MANILTAIRIVCGLLITVLPAFTGWFYCFYLFGGFTDAIDETVARRQGKVINNDVIVLDIINEKMVF